MEINLLVSDLLVIHVHMLPSHRYLSSGFQPVLGVHPSLTLKASVVHACNDQDGTLFDVSDAGSCH
jgi:hypothetical protein